MFANTVEVEVTGIHERRNNDVIVLAGRVRGAELPADVTFACLNKTVSGIIGALAAGETVTLDIDPRMLVGR